MAALHLLRTARRRLSQACCSSRSIWRAVLWALRDDGGMFSCIGFLTYVTSQRAPPEPAGGAAASSGIHTDDESLLFHSLSVA